MDAGDFLNRQETKDYLAINDAECYLLEIKSTVTRLESLFRNNYRLKEYDFILENVEKIKASLLDGTRAIRKTLTELQKEIKTT